MGLKADKRELIYFDKGGIFYSLTEAFQYMRRNCVYPTYIIKGVVFITAPNGVFRIEESQSGEKAYWWAEVTRLDK